MKIYCASSTVKRHVLLTLVISFFFLASTVKGQRSAINLKYLGCAGWEITDSNITVLIDPYISRVKLGKGPSISKEDTRKSYSGSDYYEPDTALINRVITKADFILVHHSHFDHIADVPYIAAKTGAKVIGTASTINLLRAYGVPKEQLYTVKGGEDYQFENFSVRVIKSLHSPLNKKHYYDPRTIPVDIELPLKINEHSEGGSLQFFARFESHTVLTAGSMNFIEREVEGLRPDILMPGVNFSRLEIYMYTERLLTATGFPKIVIPTHWDNFRIPYGFSQEKAINDKIKPFIKEVEAASPNSKVIIPVHLETISLNK